MTPDITTLASGLRIVSVNLPHVETVSIGIHAAAGSRAEQAGEHGLAHFLEHMAFKGTRRRTARQIAEEIEAVGGDINAATSVETTAYHARLLGSDLGLGLDILTDILTQSTFEADEIEREKGVVLQEIAAVDDTPDDLVFDMFTATAFDEQPIGRPILGTPETVKELDASLIRAFLSREYRAQRLVVSAAGAVNHGELVAAAERALASLPLADTAESPRARYVGGERRTKRKLEQAHVVLGFESPSLHDRDFYAAQIFANILGGGMSSRLFQEVREKRGLAYSIYSFVWGYSDTGLFGVYLGTGSKTLQEGTDVSLDCLAQSIEDINQAELDRARAQIKVSLLMSLESSAGRSDQMARQLLAYDRLISTAEIVDRIDALTVADIRAVGRRILRSAPSLAAVGPVGKLKPRDHIAARLGSPM
jgi:predicted Zn-dependent peptidase